MSSSNPRLDEEARYSSIQSDISSLNQKIESQKANIDQLTINLSKELVKQNSLGSLKKARHAIIQDTKYSQENRNIATSGLTELTRDLSNNSKKIEGINDAIRIANADLRCFQEFLKIKENALQECRNKILQLNNERINEINAHTQPIDEHQRLIKSQLNKITILPRNYSLNSAQDPDEDLLHEELDNTP